MGSTAGALHVTRLRSTPRQAYRIYSEEEFLAAEDWHGEAEPEFALRGQAGRRREARRWGGFAAPMALASVVAAVVGVVALHVARSRSQSERGFAVGVATRGRSPAEIVAARSSAEPLDSPPRKRTRQGSVAVRRVAEHRPLPANRPPRSAHPYRSSRPTPPAEAVSVPTTPAGAAISTTAASTTAASGTAAPTPVTTATPTTATASTPAATATVAASPTRGAGAEFGFERR